MDERTHDADYDGMARNQSIFYKDRRPPIDSDFDRIRRNPPISHILRLHQEGIANSGMYMKIGIGIGRELPDAVHHALGREAGQK